MISNPESGKTIKIAEVKTVTQEKILIPVDATPASGKQMMKAIHRSNTLQIPLIVGHVRTGNSLTSKEDEILQDNLRLAAEAGAQIITAADDDYLSGLLRIGRENGITEIMVANPPRTKFRHKVRDFFHGGTFTDRLQRAATDMNICIVPNDSPVEYESVFLKSESTLLQYFLCVLLVGLAGLCLWLLKPVLEPHAIGFSFLLIIMLLSFFFSRGPVFLAALLSALIFNLFFLPPLFTLYIRKVSDWLLLVNYFVAANLSGTLTSVILTQNRKLTRSETRMRQLFEFADFLNKTSDISQIVHYTEKTMSKYLKMEVRIMIKHGKEEIPTSESAELTPDERRIAEQILENAENKADYRIPPIPNRSFHLLKTISALMGIIVVRKNTVGNLLKEEEDHINSLGGILAFAVERQMLEMEMRKNRLVAESEKLYRTIFNSVTHEIRTPLAIIQGILSSELATAPENLRVKLISDLSIATRKLVRIVDNLLDMSRLEAGLIRLKLDWQDIPDIVNSSLNSLEMDLADCKMHIGIPESIPLIFSDSYLLEQVLTNLLLNAARHGNPGSAIELSVEETPTEIIIEVADQGKGIAPGEEENIFRRFQNTEGKGNLHLGLGLSIARGYMELHGGRLEVTKKTNSDATNGASFRMILPKENIPVFDKKSIPII